MRKFRQGSTPAASTNFCKDLQINLGLTGKQREYSRGKTIAKKSAEFPKRLKEGSTEVTIFRQSNPSRRLNANTGQWEATGKVFNGYVLAYYQGVRQVADKKTGETKTLPKFVRQKFGDVSHRFRSAANGVIAKR